MIRWLFALLFASIAAIGQPSSIVAERYEPCRLGASDEAAFVSASSRYDVPLDVLHAMAWVESRCNAGAIGDAGEIGMFQIMPKENGYFDRPSANHLKSVAVNVHEAARILRENQDRYCTKHNRLYGTSWRCPLAVYNAGTLPFFTGQLTPRGAWYADYVLSARPQGALGIIFIIGRES